MESIFTLSESLRMCIMCHSSCRK